MVQDLQAKQRGITTRKKEGQIQEGGRDRLLRQNPATIDGAITERNPPQENEIQAKKEAKKEGVQDHYRSAEERRRAHKLESNTSFKTLLW